MKEFGPVGGGGMHQKPLYVDLPLDSGKNIQTSFKTINRERRENYYLQRSNSEKPDKELLERFEQLREILKTFNQNLLQLRT